MRGLVVKIFVFSVLVQIITHVMWVTMAVWFGGQAPGPVRLLHTVLPLYVDIARTALQRDGQPGLDALLRRVAADGDMRIEAHENVAACKPDRSMGPMAQAAGDARFCLTAGPNPPEPHLWSDSAVLLQLGLCALFSYGLARYLLRPIQVLSATAEALGRGDMTARAGPLLGRRRGGAGALVQQFDHMADQIAILIQSQQRFIGDVSHEIKSPLARLTLAIGLARRETGGLAASRFDRMEGEVAAVSALIRELLTLSSLQAREVADRSELVDLERLVRAVINDAGFEWRDRMMDIQVSMPAGGSQIHGDAILLRRAFENVLRNALFYTPPGTKVEIAVKNTGGMVTLQVRDQGPGVPAHALERLFDPFYRVDDARARHTGGAGIGLSICERAIRLHGGAVRAENVYPSGLAVSLDLPQRAGGVAVLA